MNKLILSVLMFLAGTASAYYAIWDDSKSPKTIAGVSAIAWSPVPAGYSMTFIVDTGTRAFSAHDFDGAAFADYTYDGTKFQVSKVVSYTVTPVTAAQDTTLK